MTQTQPLPTPFQLDVLTAARTRPPGMSAASIAKAMRRPPPSFLNDLAACTRNGWLRVVQGQYQLTPAGQAMQEQKNKPTAVKVEPAE